MAFLEVELHFFGEGYCCLNTKLCGDSFRPDVGGISMSRESVAGSHLSVTDERDKCAMGQMDESPPVMCLGMIAYPRIVFPPFTSSANIVKHHMQFLLRVYWRLRQSSLLLRELKPFPSRL